MGSQARLINIKTGAYSRTPHAVFVGIFCYWGLEGIKESNASKKKYFRIPHIYRVLNLLNWDPGGSGWVRDLKKHAKLIFGPK